MNYAEQLEYWGMAGQNYGRDHLGWDNVHAWDEGVRWDRAQRAAGKDSYRQPVLGELARRYHGQPASETQVRAVEDELRTLVAQAEAQAEVWRREAQAAEPQHADDTEWTVIGVWIGDRSVPVGVIEGSHQVSGGDTGEFPGGCWATSASGPNAESAEAKAVDEMRASDPPDDQED